MIPADIQDDSRTPLEALKAVLKGKLVIVGVGNRLRGDDGVGPALVDALQGKTSTVCIDAGTAPENYIGVIAKEGPETVLVVDAAYLGLAPGSYEVLGKEALLSHGISTHNLSPDLFMGFLESETRAAVYLLAVQPGCVAFGDTLSLPVKKTLDKIRDAILAGLQS